jgi:hypothetical protein
MQSPFSPRLQNPKEMCLDRANCNDLMEKETSKGVLGIPLALTGTEISIP